MIIISPSMLSSDLSELYKESQRMIDAGADWLHMDIMDGVFVPNITFGFPILKSLKKKLPNVFLDCHLMIVNPKKWIKQFSETASSISFHIEACEDITYAKEVIKECRHHNIEKVGIAIKPNTQITEIIPLIPLIDYVLVMTVEPGFSGQTFMKSCLLKISQLRENHPNIDIQVDGGINTETLQYCYDSGANIFVSGSTIFKSNDPQKKIQEFRNIAK
tara:strand:+ start:100 stop:753 length:654 start_codon:yes stop_codon:yes gene_type:complete